MALIKCSECNNQVSNKAASCPKCGAPINAKLSSSSQQGGGCIGKGFLMIVLFFVIVYAVNSVTDDAPKRVVDNTPKTAEEIRDAKIQAQFSLWDGTHERLKESVINSLKDPDSFENIETKYFNRNGDILVVMKFRAKNSFGGFAVQEATGIYDIDGNTVEAPVIH